MDPGIGRRTFLGAAAWGVLTLHAPYVRIVERDAASLDEVVRWILATPRERVLERAARAIRAGLDVRTLLAAVFVAAVREVSPRSARFNHAALVVPSIELLTVACSERERVGLALWGLDHLKDSQSIDAQSGDWTLGSVDAARLPSGDRARSELVGALDAWDAEAADVALTGLVRSAPQPDVVELVLEYGTRCQANLGHKAIFAAMAHRMLPSIGSRGTEDALRAVVRSYALHGKSDRTEPFEVSRALVERGLARAGAPRAADRAARDLHAALRTVKATDAPNLVACSLREGCGDAAVWDGVLAAAAEIVVAEPSVGPLHALTSVNALHYIQREARSARVRDLALLQAAAWVCVFRDAALAEASAAEIAPLSAVEMQSGFVESALARVRAEADDVHEIKLAAAVAEELARAGAHARPAVLAALRAHLPPAERRASDSLQRVRAATRTATGG